MIQRHFLAIAAMILSFAAIQAWGAGFALYENSSRGTAICGAFVARADDASALFYNPSGITQLEGRQISTGINTYTGLVDLHLPGGGIEAVQDKTWIVPNFYMSQKVTDKIWVGLGAFAPYGLGNKYREDWFGRYNMYHAEIACMEINSNLAYKVNDSFSISFGMSRQSFELLNKRKLRLKNVVIEGLVLDENLNMNMDQARAMYEAQLAQNFDSMQDIDQEVMLDKPAYRFNVSFRYQINDKLSIGGQYRSRVTYALTGNVTYKDLPSTSANYDATTNGIIEQIHDILKDARLEVDISLPDLYVFGVAYRITDKISVEADIVRTQWSNYDRINYHFDNPLGDQVDQAKWSDVNCYRFGAELQVNEQLTARLGYLFDETPLHDDYIDFSLPGNDRHLMTCGFGYKYKQFIIDGHYGLVICIDKDNRPNLNPNAFIDYEWQHRSSKTHQLGFNVSYTF
jgi:long-chain fatty acid transport protein